MSAREAALAGLTVALKKMHTGEWCYGDGVYSTLTGSLGDYESYQVTYTTGDASLSPDDLDYAMEFACRVTLLSTGTAIDPSDPARTTTHRAGAVVRLVPREIDTDDEPDQWQEMTEGYSIYQRKDGDFKVNVPFRIEGPVRAQGRVQLARARWWYPWYYWSGDAREDYFEHLGAMRLDGHPDFRTFTGPVLLPYSEQNEGLIGLLHAMDADPNKTPRDDVKDWDHPGHVATYRIYPGGKEYSVGALGYSQQNVAWKPDPETNPLGIYYRDGTVSLYDNVTIEGTLITKGSSDGDVHIHGTNVHLAPRDLLPLYGSDRPIRLPMAIIEDDFRIHDGAQGGVTGLLAIGDEFEILKGGQHDIQVTVEGPIVAEDVLIHPRCEWYDGKDSDWWDTVYDAFLDQEEDGEPYFPAWLSDVHGLDSEPRLLIRPETRDAGDPPPRYHWKNQYDTIYVPHEDDDGLRWDVVEWTDRVQPEEPFGQ